ncbi:MAG: type II methionyl aminopeptidase [Candidatus Altiarchaeota archaeon]
MEEKVLESYRKAGGIAKEVREWSRSLVKADASILEIAERIEAKIRETADVAFPTNICINDVTAHYTPKFDDKTTLSKKDVVSVDLGVHVDGYIADTAYTVDLSGNYSKLLDANRKALQESIELVKPGESVNTIGGAVQRIITGAGFKPIENLTGHEVRQYDLHAGLHIPNIRVPYDWKIEEDMVLALEPFATDGYGRVVESKYAEIYSLMGMKPTRLKEARILMNEVEPREGLPFAARWYSKKINPLRFNLALKEMVSKGILREYPTLHEKEKGIVSQFEHTVLVTSDGCEVLT